MKIIESLLMTKPVEDWSRVRSPSRARRRLRQGHPQNIHTLQVPRTDAITTDGGASYVMHPETAKEFRRMVAYQDMERHVRNRPIAFGGGRLCGKTWGGSLFAMTGNS